MKAFTDIEQSKKLAEILPFETADMWWREVSYGFYHIEAEISKSWYDVPPKGIPCWSLAALLDLMQIDCKIEKTAFDQTNEFTYSIWADYFNINTDEYDELVDACVEMITKLHEQKVL